MNQPLTAQQLAQRCAETMQEGDAASASLGLTLYAVRPGRAEMTMVVQSFMLNGYGVCHGGYLFTLADAAFAYASNTYNQVTVAQHCSISYLAPAREGSTLTAVAVERQRVGRAGIYDVTVFDESGTTIAEFRGLSRTLRSAVLEEGDSEGGKSGKER